MKTLSISIAEAIKIAEAQKHLDRYFEEHKTFFPGQVETFWFLGTGFLIFSFLLCAFALITEGTLTIFFYLLLLAPSFCFYLLCGRGCVQKGKTMERFYQEFPEEAKIIDAWRFINK